MQHPSLTVEKDHISMSQRVCCSGKHSNPRPNNALHTVQAMWYAVEGPPHSLLKVNGSGVPGVDLVQQTDVLDTVQGEPHAHL